MKSILVLIAAATFAAAGNHTFYDLQLFSPSGVNITEFGGTLKVPEYPPGYPGSGGTFYLWPGLQSTSVSGVFQQVMSPSSDADTWAIDSGDYPRSNFQGGLSGLQPGDEIYFYNYDDGNGQWTTEFAYAGQPVSVTDDWPDYQDLSFNIALWTIEIYSAAWDFGEFSFYDTFVTWESTDTSPCTDGSVQPYNSFSYTVSGASASVNDGKTTCMFSQISLISPST